jgi:hypothetical protein
MAEELQVFFSMQKGVAIKKTMLLLGITLATWYVAAI